VSKIEKMLREIVDRSSDPFPGSAPDVQFCKVPAELIAQARKLLQHEVSARYARAKG
jgi:hypothetical protein